jgi:hypothetical protein
MPTWDTAQIRPVAPRVAAIPAAVIIALLAVGCGATHPGPHRATVGTCFSFGVRAIQQRLIVTKVPPACAGLGHEQVNIALARALRAAVGPRPKAAQRRAAERESKYLADLFATVPPPRAEPVTATPQQPSADQPLQFAAVGAWLATATAGAYLLAGWVGAARRRRSRPAPVVIGHASLAIAGLGIWAAFLVTSVPWLAWLAVGAILVVAGLGMATLVTGLPDPRAGGRTAAGRPTAQVLVIVGHGMMATAAILLVLLAAIGAG